MRKTITPAQLAKLKKNGASIVKKEKPKPKPALVSAAVVTTSSPEMIAAVRAAEAAVKAAQAAKDMAVSVTQDNKKFLISMVEVMKGTQVTKMKINRNKKDQMTTIELIRSSS